MVREGTVVVEPQQALRRGLKGAMGTETEATQKQGGVNTKLQPTDKVKVTKGTKGERVLSISVTRGNKITLMLSCSCQAAVKENACIETSLATRDEKERATETRTKGQRSTNIDEQLVKDKRGRQRGTTTQAWQLSSHQKTD